MSTSEQLRREAKMLVTGDPEIRRIIDALLEALEQADSRVPALVEALKEAEEEIRQSKFRYESITPEIGFGEINQWIHSRDVALLHVRNTLAAFEGLSNENQFVW